MNHIEKATEIQKIVAKEYKVTVAELISRSIERKLRRPRDDAWYRTKQSTDLTHAEIGELYGGRTKTTIINGINRFKKELDKNISNML